MRTPTQAIMRGDIVVVDLNPTLGSEQQGRSRPCVVVQNNIGNLHANTTIIVPVTDAAGKQVYPFQSIIPKGDGGLNKPSIALCNQIRLISKERIKDKIGSLSDTAVDALNAALLTSLGFRG